MFVFIAISTKISKKVTLKDNIRSYIPKKGECQIYKLYLPICINQMKTVGAFPYFHQEVLAQAVYHMFRLHVTGSYFFFQLSLIEISQTRESFLE